MSKKSIILRKVGGFYQTFDDDALIISYFFDYKIVNYKCGFPISVIEKIINVLEENTINYTIKQEEEITKDFKTKNNYDKYLEKGKVKNDLRKRIEKILGKLSELNEIELNKLLDEIEEKINI